MSDVSVLAKIKAVSPRSIESVLDAFQLADNPTPKILQAISRIAWRATSIESVRTHRRAYELIAKIHGVLRNPLSGPIAQELGVSALVNLAFVSELRRQMSVESVAVVLMVMNKSSDSIKIQEACIGLLNELVTSKECTAKGMESVAKDGFKPIIAALERYSNGSRLIREKGVTVLQGVLKSGAAEASKLFCGAGGCNILRSIIDNHSNVDNKNTYFACVSIATILARDQSCAEHLLCSGVAGSIAQVVGTLWGGSALLKPSLGFLSIAASYGEQLAGFDYLCLLERATELLKHVGDDVKPECVRVIASILADNNNNNNRRSDGGEGGSSGSGSSHLKVNKFVELGGVHLVVDMMRRVQSLQPKHYGSSVIWAVSYFGNARAQEEIVRECATKYVTAALCAAVYSKERIGQELGALWSLTARRENVCIALGAGCLRLLGEALSGYTASSGSDLNEADTECVGYLLGTLWNISQTKTERDMTQFPVIAVMKFMSQARLTPDLAKLGMGVLASYVPSTVNSLGKEPMAECVAIASKAMKMFPEDKSIQTLCCDTLYGMVKNVIRPINAELHKNLSTESVLVPMVKVLSQFKACLPLRKKAVTVLLKASTVKQSAKAFVDYALNEVIAELRFVSNEVPSDANRLGKKATNSEDYESEVDICKKCYNIISLVIRSASKDVPRILTKHGFEDIVFKSLHKFFGVSSLCAQCFNAAWNYIIEAPSASDRFLELGISKTVFEDILPHLDPANDESAIVSTLNVIVTVLASKAAYDKYMTQSYRAFVGTNLLEKARDKPRIRFLACVLLRTGGRPSVPETCSVTSLECREQCEFKKRSTYCEKCTPAQDGYRCRACGKCFCLRCGQRCPTHTCNNNNNNNSSSNSNSSTERFVPIYMPFRCACESNECKDSNYLRMQPPPQKILKTSAIK